MRIFPERTPPQPLPIQRRGVSGPMAMARQDIINENRTRALTVIGSILGLVGFGAGAYAVTGKNVPEDSSLGRELAPLVEAYTAEAAGYRSIGEMVAAYQAPEGVSPYEYRTPLEEIEDRRRAIIKTRGCTDKSDWTVGEPDWGVKSKGMVTATNTRVNLGCKVD